jgi:hypothetical protein
MHASVKRLLEYARERTAGSTDPVLEAADLGRQLHLSKGRFSNWKTRGVSKEGALDAERKWGCSPTWVLDGSGPRDSARAAAPPAPAPISLNEARGRPSLTAALDVLGDALVAAEPETRKEVLKMLELFLGNPKANHAIAPIIVERLLGEIPPEEDKDGSGQKAA